MALQETVLKITDYDEILNLHGERLLLITNHKEIFSLHETQDTKLTKPSIYEEDDFFDYIKEVDSNRPTFDFKKFFNYKQKRIGSKRAKENLHSKEDFPMLSSPVKETLRTRRQKLPYCQSEIFPSIDNNSSFLRRWQNFSLPRFTIYRMSKQGIGSLRFDQIASALSMDADGRNRLKSEFDMESMRILNDLLNKDGHYKQYCLKSHLRQHKDDQDILELFRIFSSGLQKAPPVYYDSNAEIKPSLKHIASLEVLDSEKALVDTYRRPSVKSETTFLEDSKKQRDHVRFEQMKSVLPDFMYTGEEQFRVIVYDDEVPYLDFELDSEYTKKKPWKSESEESVLKLRPDITDIKLSDTSLIGMGDYGIKPEDIGKPVMLKFKNMPELLGWFRKINEQDLEPLTSETSDGFTQSKVLDEVTGQPKKGLREVVVGTPIVGLRRYRPAKPEDGIDFKKMDITTHDTILSILPKCLNKDYSLSDTDLKDECISMETVLDRFTSTCAIKKKPGLRNVTYKTRSSRKDSLQRIKSSIVNEVVKKVASYFSKDMKPKLEATIKEGQCKCCHNKSISAKKVADEKVQGKHLKPPRACMCNQKKPPKVSKGVNVDLNDLSNDASSSDFPPAGCRPNFSIFTCPTMTYFRNTGVNADLNLIADQGSCGDSLPVMPFDCQKILQMYQELAKTAEEQMKKLKEFQSVMEVQQKDVQLCNDVLQQTTEKELVQEEVENVCNIPADFSNHVLCLPDRRDNVDDVNLLEEPKLVDYTLDSCSSNESLQSLAETRKDILKLNTIRSKPTLSVCKVTSHRKKYLDDTYNVTDISDFECYIHYICTHSEQFVQINEDLTVKKLKRQTSRTNLTRLKKNLNGDAKNFVKFTQKDVETKNELVTLFQGF